MTMKNKQRFTLVYAAPGFFRKRRDGKEKEIEPPEEPEYPACYDEEPEMKREPEEFVCVYASPEWFENRERERREAEEFKDVYASPEWFAGKREQEPETDEPAPKEPEPVRPARPREPVFRALYAAPERFPKAERPPLFEKVYAGPRVPEGERVTIEAGKERCRKCGYPTVAGAKYCFNCGTRLTSPGDGCVEI